MKVFNTTVSCVPTKHYMVDMSSRIDAISATLIEQGKYFVINRARQYGKTTILHALKRALSSRYHVLSISFAGRPSMFENEKTFVNGFVRKLHSAMKRIGMDEQVIDVFSIPGDSMDPLADLNDAITALCDACDKEIILMIDEVDEATNNEIMIYFLATLRDKYILRENGEDNTFKSVILAGVYDVTNLQLKIRPESEHRYNSPWNVAANFDIDMSFKPYEIKEMLEEYRQDYRLGFDANLFADQIYDYTSGYPYLVSKICWLLDNKVCKETEFGSKEAAWTKQGFQRAIKLLLKENNPLFEDLYKKLEDNPKLKDEVYRILIEKKRVEFNPSDPLVRMGYMFGWFKDVDGNAMISNRIFETVILNRLLREHSDSQLYMAGTAEQTQFIVNGELNMHRIVERFAAHYHELYATQTERFLENQMRILFLCFLKPIINGAGNYYLETESFDKKKADIVVDYHGKRYLIELKIWHGENYEQSGREQLVGYLERYGLSEGWLLSFCFNKNKEQLIGTKAMEMDGKTIFETVI